jgi:hypothetical protein
MEEIMEDPTINKSFSAVTFLLTSSFSDYYSAFSFPYFTTSNAKSSSSVFTSDLDNCYYEY